MTDTLTDQRTPDAFANAIRDILTERWPSDDVPESHDRTIVIDDLVALITDAYIPRIRTERQTVRRQTQEIATLVDRDRTLHELIRQLRRRAEMFTDSQVRADCTITQLVRQLEGVRQVLDDAEHAGATMVAVAEILGPLARGLYPVPTVGASPVAIAPDAKWSFGIFRRPAAADDAPRKHYPFVGWAVVLRSTTSSQLESVFLVDGQPLALSALAELGLILEQLV